MSTSFVFVRIRKVQLQDVLKTFLEFFVDLIEIYDPIATEPKFVLQWPTSLGRFEKRILGMPLRFDDLEVCLVQSEAPPQVQKRTLENLKSGAWITYNDSVPRGGLPQLGVPELATFQGIPIDFRVSHFLMNSIAKVYTALKVNLYDDPIVVYHGTSKSNVKTIVQESMKPSQGMFGNCIQFGNFWKAFRFAVMDQDFKGRPGGIFRVYAFWKHLALRTPACSPCQCAVCSKARIHQGPQAVSYLSDHLSTWIKEGDAVQTPILWNSQTRQYFCKSEEQATLNTSKIFVESVCFVEATDSQLQNRDPLDRNLKLL